jgi:hypothetical protein|tara:strand:+ start:295 stop:810 length:516 start_codon:yes stop_codon:yes gene_type:complete
MRQSKQTKKGGFTMSDLMKNSVIGSVVSGGSNDASFVAMVDFMIESVISGFNGMFTNDTLGDEFPSLKQGTTQPRHIFQDYGLKGSGIWKIVVVAKPIKSGEVNSQGTLKYFAIAKSPKVKVEYAVAECDKRLFDYYTETTKDMTKKSQRIITLEQGKNLSEIVPKGWKKS